MNQPPLPPWRVRLGQLGLAHEELAAALRIIIMRYPDADRELLVSLGWSMEA